MASPLVHTLLKTFERMSPEGRRLASLAFGDGIARACAPTRLQAFYPDEGPLRRDLYVPHMEFFAAGGWHDPMPTCPENCDGSPHRERLMLAANRVGKSEGVGGYETALHLTGRYPDWWPGRRFEHPVEFWAAGKRNETTRDIVQKILLGETVWRGSKKTVDGSGLIPSEDIGDPTWKRGINLIDKIKVRSRFGGWSELGLKSYEQGRGAFEGTAKHGIWFDEEPPLEVYTEGLVRTMTTGGIMLLTFTPMEGMSKVVMEYLPDGSVPERRVRRV
jgi:phage terminase large subunit-like protein